MRLLLFLNNWGSWQLARWLRAQREDIVAVVVQPDHDQRFAREILDVLQMPADRVWTAPQLRDSREVSRISELRPDIGISSFFGYVLKPEMLSLPPHGCINLHSAYLPFNRGWNTNVWPIIDGTPAGVSIHYMDEGVDTGDIIAQRIIGVRATDTGGSLHQRLTRALVELFQRVWPFIKNGQHVRTRQATAFGSAHRRAELSTIDEIHLDAQYRGLDLINLLRARTYSPFPAAYFVADSRKTYVRVQLLSEADLSVGGPSAALLHSKPVDLDRAYTADQLLRLLSAPEGGGAHYVDLIEKNRIFIQAQFLSENDVDPQGTPQWD